MGENKKTRKKIASLEDIIAEHERKIAQMLKVPNPNQGRIRHWEGEIRGHRKTLTRLYKKLPGRRKL